MWAPGSPIVAVASDVPMVGLGVPNLDLNRPETVARFILARLGASASARLSAQG